MYTQLRESLAGAARPSSLSPTQLLAGGVSRNVLFLGLTSLFTDISSEMISTVLPLYVVFFLRLSPLEFGLLDGLYQGVSAIVRVFSGYIADRSRRHKEVAVLGYGLSMVCRVVLLFAGSAWGVLAATVIVDRTGKGIRTAPRDALISLSVPQASLGAAFGVHRALDTFGAMIGPLLAFAILTILPGAFDAVFVASLCAAVVGLGVLGLFVENRHPVARADRRPPPSVRDMLGLLSAARFRVVVLAAGLLALATVSDAFVYLGLQRKLAFNANLIPLLYVGTALFYLILAIPAGHLADRIGRKRMFVGGYALLVLVYASLLAPSLGPVELFVCLFLFGAYYAATDGVLMALASTLLPVELRTTGLALLSTATGLARLVASVLFGAVWTWWGLEPAAGLFMGGLVAALGLTLLALWRAKRGAVAHAV
jgi:MFS family permease